MNLLRKLSKNTNLPIKDELSINENLNYFAISDAEIMNYFKKYQDWKYGLRDFDVKMARNLYKVAMNSLK